MTFFAGFFFADRIENSAIFLQYPTRSISSFPCQFLVCQRKLNSLPLSFEWGFNGGNTIDGEFLQFLTTEFIYLMMISARHQLVNEN